MKSCWTAATAVLCFSCSPGTNLHVCSTLDDCPPGYTACVDGYCLEQHSCEGVPFRPDDGCCPSLEGDRTEDTDCLVIDVQTGYSLSTPVIGPEGGLFFAGLKVDQESRVVLARIHPDGQSPDSVLAGDWDRVLPVLLSKADSLYVAVEHGVRRYDRKTLLEQDFIGSATVEGGLACNEDGVVGWPCSDGTIVLYDENTLVPIQFDAAGLSGEPWKEDERFLPPVVGGSGRRMYIATDAGRLVAVEMKRNPRGPIAFHDLLAPIVSPPVESGGVVYVVTGGHVLHALLVQQQAHDFETQWTLSLDGAPAGRPLIDGDGDLVLALLNGEIVLVADRGLKAEVLVKGAFGKDVRLADMTPFLTDSGRIMALAEDLRAVITAVTKAAEDGARIEPGFRFSLPAAAVSPPTVWSESIVVPLASSHLTGWALREGVPGSGFYCSGGNIENTCKVRTEQ